MTDISKPSKRITHTKGTVNCRQVIHAFFRVRRFFERHPMRAAEQNFSENSLNNHAYEDRQTDKDPWLSRIILSRIILAQATDNGAVVEFLVLLLPLCWRRFQSVFVVLDDRVNSFVLSLRFKCPRFGICTIDQVSEPDNVVTSLSRLHCFNKNINWQANNHMTFKWQM